MNESLGDENTAEVLDSTNVLYFFGTTCRFLCNYRLHSIANTGNGHLFKRFCGSLHTSLCQRIPEDVTLKSKAAGRITASVLFQDGAVTQIQNERLARRVRSYLPSLGEDSGNLVRL